MIEEKVDSFGLPINEARRSPAEGARDRLERAKDEVRRALDELRDLQAEHDAKERIGAEIKSAIVATINVEQTLITAIHRVENIVHRVKKMDMAESVINEEVVRVPFKSGKDRYVALFDVSGRLEKNERGDVGWVGEHKAKFLRLQTEDGKDSSARLKASDLSRLEDRALEAYADNYFSR